jgi:glutamyl-Q tRNA(Asp) synthetase
MTQPNTTQHIATRFAPSPTGRLHIGHAWSALMAQDFARSRGGLFRLRIEDIDGARSRPEHIAGIIEDLEWLGIRWDGAAILQSDRLSRYEAALEQLKSRSLVYPCFCTRAEVAAEIAASGSAPHSSDGLVYPGTCRHLSGDERVARLASYPHCWRLDMEAALAQVGVVNWTDGGGSRVLARPERAGDVVLARKDAPTSYHLAATLDDADMGISDIIRGHDLRDATDIHALLQKLLGLPSPRYHFHGLLVDAEGKRLAKRTAGLALAELRQGGADPAVLVKDLRAGVFPFGIFLQSF